MIVSVDVYSQQGLDFFLLTRQPGLVLIPAILTSKGNTLYDHPLQPKPTGLTSSFSVVASLVATLDPVREGN